MQLQPYFIVPTLIEQPTWGGSYICTLKGCAGSPLDIEQKKIGQAYELSGTSLLHDQQNEPNIFCLGSADHPDQVIFSQKMTPVSIADLIQHNPSLILGEKIFKKYGPTMPLLIKLTQAKENSYQVHVKPGKEFAGWVAKPETWFYLEDGLATLGIKDSTLVGQYQKRCANILEYSQSLSGQVKAGILDITAARNMLEEHIAHDHPRQYVNTVHIAKGQVVDLSQGGVHHSWESSPDQPDGNIVYEVQLDVLDAVSTLRSYDQGKMKDDGSIRALTIEDYFQALDISAENNDPSNLIRTPQTTTDGTTMVSAVCSTRYYSMHQLHLTTTYTGFHTSLTHSFHHLFSLDKTVTVEWQERSWQLPAGYSLFIPAGCKQYSLHATTPSTVIVTQAIAE